MDEYPNDGGVASAVRAAVGKNTVKTLERNPMVTRVALDKIEMFGRPSFLSPEECDTLVAMVDANAVPSSLFSGDPGFRTSHSCNFNVYDPLLVAITDRICRIMAMEPDHSEAMQGQRYEVSQEYKAHCDYFPVTESYWPEMRVTGGQRVWTAMIYLNDVTEGGETHFPHLGFKVPPRRGMLLIWNNMRPDGSPNPFTLHAALPVLSGVKYVATKWFRERRWLPRNAA